MSEAHLPNRGKAKAQFTAGLLLEKQVKLSFSQIEAELKRVAPQAVLGDWGSPVTNPAVDPGVEMLSLNGENLSVLVIDAPAPAAVLQPGPFANPLWPNAESDAAQHKAHIVVIGLGDPIDRESALAKARTVTLLATAVARLVPTIGVTWVDGANLVRAATFAEMTKNIGQPDANAVPFWLRIMLAKGPPGARGEATMKAGTLGLRIFGLRELEYAPVPLDPAFILQHAYSVAEYLLRSGKRLADGETIGVEGQARFTISHADAGDFVSYPIARLSLQTNRSDATAATSGLEPTVWNIPWRLGILTVFCLGAAGMTGYYSLKDSWDAEAMRAHGRDAPAEIIGFHATVDSDRTISYAIDLAWRDGSGAERHFGPTHISGAYAQRIAANGALIARQTTIRYLEEDRSARPIILADADEQTKQNRIGRVMAAVFGVVGVALAVATAWRTRQTRTYDPSVKRPTGFFSRLMGSDSKKKGIDDNARSNSPTALFVASGAGLTEIVQNLLAKGADVNAKGNDGGTALMIASARGHNEVVQALLARGADIDAKDKDGLTALMHASLTGRSEVVNALLAKGADVNAKADNGATALMGASTVGHSEVVEALLAKGADVNAKADNGATALTVSASNAQIVKLLVKAGANSNLSSSIH